jgi:RNA-directed DNA polymerase
MAKRMRAKLAEVKAILKRRRHAPVPVVGAWLQSVLRGHYRYYGVPFNYMALHRFREHLRKLWQRTLSRRSQKGRLPWAQMERIAKRWLPQPSIQHPHASVRFDARTQGRSRVR